MICCDILAPIDQIRQCNELAVSCQRSVPEPIPSTFEADGFDDAIGKAISIGGDSDVLAANSVKITVVSTWLRLFQEMRFESLPLCENGVIY